MPSLHVLVIDDEPAARQVLAAAVSDAGYSVDSAANVAEATEKLSGGDVDVALCDIQLPDGHGIDLLKQSRASGLDTPNPEAQGIIVDLMYGKLTPD